MRVRIPPLETPYSRHARLAGSLAALCFGTAGCADVLDIPAHPRLESAPASPRLARTEQPAEPESESVSDSEGVPTPSALDVPARAGAEQPLAPQFDGSGASPLSPPSPVSPPGADPYEPEAADAGAPVASASPLDASPPVSVDAPPPACAASGVVGPNGRCYATLAVLRSWTASRQRCRSIGAGWELASIRSDEVNRFLAGLLTSESWIGASDGDVEGTWLWVDDGTIFWRGDSTGGRVNRAFVNWDQSQPNGGANANCARLVPDAAGVWGDLPCTELRSAVCAGPRN
jgi:hypothetical protein